MNINIKRSTVTMALSALVLALVLALAGCGGQQEGAATDETTAPADTSEDRTVTAAIPDDAQKIEAGGGLEIDAAKVTDNATFYPLDVDGTYLEVVAIKAGDGTVRTAFNTCQVCYDSGRGYYKAEGSNLVCQNCGNTFSADQVEVRTGGCNPVPITDDMKTVNGDNITIPYDLFVEAKQIFSNWKA